MSDWAPPPDVLPGYDHWLQAGPGGPLDDDPAPTDDDPLLADDDGYVSRGGCLALLATAWVLLAAAAWQTGAPVSSAVIDAGLAVAVTTVALAAWRDRDRQVAR